MVLSVSVQAQLRRGEHIGLIFVQCWEKTSLHSLGHRGSPGAIAEWPPLARRSSHPSQTHAHLQRRGTVAPSANWGCIFLHICPISMHFIFKFLTKIYIFSASDLPRLGASHWNSKSLRLPGKLACPRKRWAACWGMRFEKPSAPDPKKKFILNPGTREYFSNFDKSCPTVVQRASNSWPLLWGRFLKIAFKL